MKFHLYKIIGHPVTAAESVPMSIAMKGVADKKNMADRERPVDKKIVVLEKGEPVASCGGYLVDMVEAGSTPVPGVYTLSKENRDLPIKSGEKISQQTMALYVSGRKHGYLICQYNHHGVKAGMIAGYFSNNKCYYELEPVVKKDVAKIFAESKSVTALHIKVAVDKMSSDFLSGGGLLRGLTRGQTPYGAGVVEVRYSQGGGKRGGELSGAKEEILALLSNGDFRDNPEIQSFDVQVRRQFDSRAEFLDLINHRVFCEIDNDTLSITPGGRYDYISRKDAIVASLTDDDFKRYIK